jgi:sodium transport system ATP-binding protein
MARVLIRFDQVEKEFAAGRWRKRRVAALCGVDWSVASGEVVAVAGPNGSGKTTLLRMIAGLLHPSRGSVRVGGLDPVKQPREVRRRIGFLTGSAVPQPRLTARETLRLFGELHGLAGRELRHCCDGWIERLGIAEFEGRPVGGLSAGMRQRVMVARALLHDPELLVFDEATTGLDPVAAEVVAGIIREAGGAGRTVVFSSHSTSEVEDLAGRLTVMGHGRLVFDGAPGRLADERRAPSVSRALVDLLATEGCA